MQQPNATENEEGDKTEPETAANSFAEAGSNSTENKGDFGGEDFSEWLEPLSGDTAFEEAAGKTDTAHAAMQIAELEAKLEELTGQIAEAHDQLLRKTADFDNFRKRMNLEKQRAIDFANESLLLDIIPVIDDFERAIQSAEVSAELTELPAGRAMLDGITMIEKQFISRLENKWGLKRFNAAGDLFDPNIHEAMLMEKSPDIEEPVVQEDLAKGYMLKDRVIRAAKVKVLMPEEAETGNGV